MPKNFITSCFTGKRFNGAVYDSETEVTHPNSHCKCRAARSFRKEPNTNVLLNSNNIQMKTSSNGSSAKRCRRDLQHRAAHLSLHNVAKRNETVDTDEENEYYSCDENFCKQ